MVIQLLISAWYSHIHPVFPSPFRAQSSSTDKRILFEKLCFLSQKVKKSVLYLLKRLAAASRLIQYPYLEMIICGLVNGNTLWQKVPDEKPETVAESGDFLEFMKNIKYHPIVARFEYASAPSFVRRSVKVAFGRLVCFVTPAVNLKKHHFRPYPRNHTSNRGRTFFVVHNTQRLDIFFKCMYLERSYFHRL